MKTKKIGFNAVVREAMREASGGPAKEIVSSIEDLVAQFGATAVTSGIFESSLGAKFNFAARTLRPLVNNNETAEQDPNGKIKTILHNAVYLTNEAADLLRCRPSTIRHAVRTGVIHGKGRPFRILGSELFKMV